MRFVKKASFWVAVVLCAAGAVSARNAGAEEPDPCEAAAKAGQALLEIQSDAACKLTINGQPQGTLVANQERAVRFAGGRQTVQCSNAEGAVAQEESEILEGCGTVRFEVAAAWGRFKAQPNGVLDTQTGLIWAKSDSGKPLDWERARQYCEAKSARLPTKDELRNLHTGNALRTPCGEFPCMTSNLFHLTGRFLWTSTPFENDAIAVGMAGVGPAAQSVNKANSQDVRVLCVSETK